MEGTKHIPKTSFDCTRVEHPWVVQGLIILGLYRGLTSLGCAGVEHPWVVQGFEHSWVLQGAIILGLDRG